MKEAEEKWTEKKLLTAIRKEIKAGGSPSAVAAKLAIASGWARRDIYKLTVPRD